MTSSVTNPVKAFALITLGLAIAAMGIYVADADDAPGAAAIGFLLMLAAVLLGVSAARGRLPIWAARTIGRARSTAAAHCGEGADALTDGTSVGCAKRDAATVTAWMRNAAPAAMRAPTANAVRAAQIGSRFRAVLTPSRTAAAISRNPPTGAPGGSSLAT